MLSDLLQWKDTPEYISAMEEWLMPLRDTVFYGGLRYAYTDIARFYGFIDSISNFSTIKNKRILDSGCGGAGLMIAMRVAGADELVGIELDREIARLADLRTMHLGGFQILQDDASLLGLAPSSFDIIMSIHVIEHVLDYENYLKTQALLLRPDGVMLLACPNQFWPIEAHSRLPFIHYFPRTIAKKIGKAFENTTFLPKVLRDRGRTATLYEHDFNIFQMRSLLQKHGFEILEINHPKHLLNDLALYQLHWLSWLIRRLPNKLLTSLGAVAPMSINAICRKIV